MRVANLPMATPATFGDIPLEPRVKDKSEEAGPSLMPPVTPRIGQKPPYRIGDSKIGTIAKDGRARRM